VKHTRLMKALVEDDGGHWVYERQPHWRKHTVAEHVWPDYVAGGKTKTRIPAGALQFTLRELCEEIVASNNAQDEYHEELLSATTRPPLPEPVEIDYAPIADTLIKYLVSSRAARATEGLWPKGAQIIETTAEERLTVRDNLKRMVEKAMRDVIAKPGQPPEKPEPQK
jgi:hypothetical protein